MNLKNNKSLSAILFLKLRISKKSFHASFSFRVIPTPRRKKPLNMKSRTASVQAAAPIHNIINVPNAVSFDHVTKEQSITRVC